MHRPWHLRLIAAIACIVALAAAADYLLTQYRVDAWLSLFDPEVVRYLKGLPDGLELAWAVAVWAGVIGAFLLLGDRRNSAMMLAVAALAAIVTTVWVVAFEPVPIQSAMGWTGAGLVIGWTVLLVLLWLYTRTMHRRGHVR